MLEKLCRLLVCLFILTTSCKAADDDLFEELFKNGLTDAEIPIPHRVPRNNAMFDYIIVGGGSAGSVLANRLTANGKYKVALLEAGGNENNITRIPAMCGMAQLMDVNWGYKTTPQKCGCHSMNDNQCAKAAGKVLGGGGSMNFLLYARGTKADHDCPNVRFNVPNWNHDTLFPYILKTEKALDMEDIDWPYHNTRGKVSVRHAAYRSSLTDSYFDAMNEIGVRNLDYNGKCKLGLSPPQTTTNREGERCSPFRGYVEKIMWKRSNLKIYTRALATEIIYDQRTKEAEGVRFLHNDREYVFRARREVILSAGVFNSPKLLMLSGIGPKSCLNKVGIRQRHNLPVGRSIREHTSYYGPVVTVNTTGQTLFLGAETIADIARYAQGQDDTRLSVAFGAVESLGFFKFANSKNPKNTPDIEFLLVNGGYASDGGTGLKVVNNMKDEVFEQYYAPLLGDPANNIPPQDHFSIVMTALHPHSQGSYCLNSKDPLDHPFIDPNILGDKRDVDLLYRANKLFLKMLETEPMKKLNAKLLPTPYPGCEKYRNGSKCYWRCVIRSSVYMYDHEMGTCRMGCHNDPGAVVNSKLCVYGMKKLRVVDNSVWPCTTSGHTNYKAMMIAERAADLILSGKCDGAPEQCVYKGRANNEPERVGYTDCERDCIEDEEESAAEQADTLRIVQCVNENKKKRKHCQKHKVCHKCNFYNQFRPYYYN